MSEETKVVKEPLFHIVKRDYMPLRKTLLIRVGAVLGAILLSCILCGIVAKENPFYAFSALFDGALGTERRVWILLQDTALLLTVSLAIVPAFKMKFWNLGGNGQVLMGCLATTACMFYLGGKLPDGVVIVFMILSSITVGAIWAVIPAIFKAFFKTNESLFTLMMNYIATGLVAFALTFWAKDGSAVLRPIQYANLPTIINKHFLPVLVSFVVLIAMYIYLKHSKHGYEISVVGESENTAKYIGIRVKKVIIRTMLVSGAICGLVGLVLVGGINHTVNEQMANNMGFTAIMVAWLAQLNPLIMAGVSLFIVFLTKGMGQVRKDFGFTNEALANVVIGIVYFFLIASEFFIRYKFIFRKKKTVEATDEESGKTEKEEA
ncbi:MAG: ABC transporter permease [Clostridia bacterium]|nr:ABC transporter permease [Clostridia bacterium]